MSLSDATRSTNQKRFLVTGGTGLIGSWIIKSLYENGVPVRATKRATSTIPTFLESLDIEWVDADILNPVDLRQAFDGIQNVIHSAALISFNPLEFDSMFDINVKGTTNVVDISLQMNVDRFLFVSSIASIGRSSTLTTLDESVKWARSLENSKYSESKYLAELEVWRGVEEGLKGSIVNPSTVLGPGDWHRSSTQLFRYAWEEHRYYPTGLLNYVDLRDVVEMSLKVFESPEAIGNRFILNGGHIEFKEFFEMTSKEFGKTAPKQPVNHQIAKLLIPIEKFRSLVTGKSPLITRETLRSSSSRKIFDSGRIKSLIGLNFTPLKDSIRWTCGELSRMYDLRKSDYQSAV